MSFLKIICDFFKSVFCPSSCLSSCCKHEKVIHVQNENGENTNKTSFNEGIHVELTNKPIKYNCNLNMFWSCFSCSVIKE